MPNYLVWPLETQPSHLYRTLGFDLRSGVKVDCPNGKEAAMAVMGKDEEHTIRHFVVVGPEGVEEFNFEPMEGFETLSLLEQPHR